MLPRRVPVTAGTLFSVGSRCTKSAEGAELKVASGKRRGAPLTTGIHTLQAIKYSSAVDSDPAIDATPTDAATTGNQFRFTDGQWQFNLNTKALGGNAQGTWLLKTTLFDGSSYTVWISIKK